MESFVQLCSGTTPRRIHRDVGELKDDELGRYGFTGRTAHLYRRNDPTQYRLEGELQLVDCHTHDLRPTDLEAGGEPLLMFHNDDCRISLSRRSQTAPFFTRNVAGDELAFVHQGSGHFETEFGRLPYRPGDWIYLPKGMTYRQVPDGPSHLLLIEATEEFRVPEAGTLGRFFPFDSSLITVPEAEVFPEDGREEYEIRLRYRGTGSTSVFYAFNPLDVAGWKGDNFPFSFNIEDYDVINSDDVHLPPTVHLFMQATGVYVMNFLPRRAESATGAERIPWYHRNADFDEVAFYHGGDVFGIDMPAGLISLAPQGLHHGIPERARERSRRRFDIDERVGWQVIAIDCRRHLIPTDAVVAAEQVDVPEEVRV